MSGRSGIEYNKVVDIDTRDHQFAHAVEQRNLLYARHR